MLSFSAMSRIPCRLVSLSRPSFNFHLWKCSYDVKMRLFSTQSNGDSSQHAHSEEPSKLTADPDLARFLAKSGAVSIYSLAGMTALGTIGIDTTPLLTGIGITGFTIGFALKEIATNFLSGVMLVFGKPFRKGQWLKVLGSSVSQQLEGEVQSIDARYVLLRTKDKSLVMIPSVVVYTSPILVSNGINNNNNNGSSSSNNGSDNNSILSNINSTVSNTATSHVNSPTASSTIKSDQKNNN